MSAAWHGVVSLVGGVNRAVFSNVPFLDRDELGLLRAFSVSGREFVLDPDDVRFITWTPRVAESRS